MLQRSLESDFHPYCYCSNVSPEVRGWLYPSLPHSGDVEMWLRLATRGQVAELRGTVQAYYRLHDKNMHKKWFNDFLLNDRELESLRNILH